MTEKTYKRQKNASFMTLNLFFLMKFTYKSIMLIGMFIFIGAFLNIETLSSIIKIVDPESTETLLTLTKHFLIIFGIYKYLSNFFTDFNELVQAKEVIIQKLNTELNNGK